MKRKFIVWSLCCLLLSPLLTFAKVGSEVEQEWVIVFNDPRPARLQGWSNSGYNSKSSGYQSSLELKRFGRKIASQYDMQLKDEWLIQSLGVYCLVVRFNQDQDSTMSKLKQNKRIQWIQLSNGFELLSDEQALNSQPKDGVSKRVSFAAYNLPETLNGEGVVIAIVDSSVDRSHPDLVKSINRNDDFVVSGTNVSLGEAHGTAIAGVMVSQPSSKFGVRGVSPAAKIEAYRGCWENRGGSTQCNTLSLARALDAVASSDVDILNLSLTGPSDQLLDRLLDKIIAKKVMVVAAFDPSRPNTKRFPRPREGVLIVRASNLDQIYDDIFTAPGSRVVASPGNRYDFMSGHSVAAAYTSGVLALCKQAQQNQMKVDELLRINGDCRNLSTLSGTKDLVYDLLDKVSG